MSESDEFLAQVEIVMGSIRRWDEVKWSEDWLLESDPHSGQYIADDDLWVLMFRTNPPTAVIYAIDEEKHLVTPHRLYVLER